MVATPNDSRLLGSVMLMWISGCCWCGGTFNVFSARIREVMKRRKYLSPNDYMTDRYGSTWLTLLGVAASTFQMIMITGPWRAAPHPNQHPRRPRCAPALRARAAHTRPHCDPPRAHQHPRHPRCAHALCTAHTPVRQAWSGCRSPR